MSSGCPNLSLKETRFIPNQRFSDATQHGTQTEISCMRPQQRACNWPPALYPGLHIGGVQGSGTILFRQITILIRVCFDVGQTASRPFSITNCRLVLAKQGGEEHPLAASIKCVGAIAMHASCCTDHVLLNTCCGCLH